MADNKVSIPSSTEKQSYKYLLDAALARKREQAQRAAEEQRQEMASFEDMHDEEYEEPAEEEYQSKAEQADEEDYEDDGEEAESDEKGGTPFLQQEEMDLAPVEAEEEAEAEPAGPIVVPEGKNYFRIGEVADLLRVEPHVLRYWESEFSQIRPTKSGGQRVYNRKTVECLVEIRDLLYDQGFSISGARKKLKEVRAPRKQEPAPQAGMPREELVALEKGLRELIRFAESNTAF